MAIQDVLSVLADHWQDVLARADERQQGALVDLLGRLQSGDTQLQLVGAALAVVPFDHPVALAARGLRLQGSAQALPPELLARLAGLPAALPADESDEVWLEVRARLLRSPALSAEQLRARGQDPDLPPLIRLTGDDGSVRLPRFQFGPDGSPRPVVLRINALLDAGRDPWGVADWWLEENAWLERAPARLLGVVDDRVLLAAAVSVVED